MSAPGGAWTPGTGAAPVVRAHYYNGRTSTPHRVQLWTQGRQLCIAWEGEDAPPPQVVPWYDLDLSERLDTAPRLVRLPGGAHLEVRDQAPFDTLLETMGVEDGWVARWQRHWPLALIGVAATALLCWGAYLWAVPRVAGWVAARTPASVEATMGREALDALEGKLLRPSALPAARQRQLGARLAPLLQRPGGAPVRVEFRASGIGPNAFALPGGVVVVTDALVALVGAEEELAAVVAHEVGHVHHRHVLRRLVGAGITGAVGTLILGDVSGTVAAIPTALADLAYSRDMEREADRHAVALLRQHGMAPEALARALARLVEATAPGTEDTPTEAEAKGTAADGVGAPRRGDAAPGARLRIPDYLSTHPATAERIRAIRGR